jgi:hypothetical protein
VAYGEPASYLTLQKGVDVVSSDGVVVGKVAQVLADGSTNVFDGVVIDIRSGPGGRRFVDAPEVDEVYDRALVLAIPADEVERLPEPTPAPAVMRADPSAEGRLKRTWRRITGKY